MIYVKTKIDGKELRTVITENCFFSECPVCGIETSVDYEVLNHILNEDKIEESSVYCDPCSDKYNENKRPRITLV
jgi:C4-type Zn-finger protein